MFSKSSAPGSKGGTSKRDKAGKDKRRSSRSNKGDRDSSTSVQSPTSTQWYTSVPEPDPAWTATTVFELRQELTPKRPLRSEVERERRLSRPTSGQFQVTRLGNSPSMLGRLNGSGSNRDSIGTTDSTASEEDGLPPPLPQKTREADYCNLPDDGEPMEHVRPPVVPRVRNKPPPPEPVEEGLPPTPPPKKPPLKSPAW